MSKAARVTLAASAIFMTGTIFGVHYMQQSEREVSQIAPPGDPSLHTNGALTRFASADNVQGRNSR